MRDTTKAAIMTGWHVVIALTATVFTVAEAFGQQDHSIWMSAGLWALSILAFATAVVWLMFLRNVRAEERRKTV